MRRGDFHSLRKKFFPRNIHTDSRRKRAHISLHNCANVANSSRLRHILWVLAILDQMTHAVECMWMHRKRKKCIETASGGEWRISVEFRLHIADRLIHARLHWPGYVMDFRWGRRVALRRVEATHVKIYTHGDDGVRARGRRKNNNRKKSRMIFALSLSLAFSFRIFIWWIFLASHSFLFSPFLLYFTVHIFFNFFSLLAFQHRNIFFFQLTRLFFDRNGGLNELLFLWLCRLFILAVE